MTHFTKASVHSSRGTTLSVERVNSPHATALELIAGKSLFLGAAFSTCLYLRRRILMKARRTPCSKQTPVC